MCGYIASFNIPDEDKQLWDELREVARKRRVKISKLMVEIIRRALIEMGSEVNEINVEWLIKNNPDTYDWENAPIEEVKKIGDLAFKLRVVSNKWCEYADYWEQIKEKGYYEERRRSIYTE